MTWGEIIMTLNQLRYFSTASRCHSITKAAEELFVTQPTISTAIRDLEEEFSIQLFYRKGSRLELTADGEHFLVKADDILRQCLSLQAEYKDAERIKPPIRIGIPPMLSTLFFPYLLNEFRNEYPTEPVLLEEYGSVRACDLVYNDYLDLALINMEMSNIDKFNQSVLFTSQLYYCVAPTHPYASMPSLHMEQFDNEKLLLFNADSVQNKILMVRFDSMQINPHIVMRSSQLHTVMKFIDQGDCGCFLFKEMLSQFPKCVGIPLEPAINVDVGLIWKKGKYITGEMQKFISFTEKLYLDN
jgi:DNA-binding transcriptional LysR family regulator